MNGEAGAFLDSNVVLYLLSSDRKKADRAEQLIAAGAVLGVQVLNEVVNVMRRKLRMSWVEVDEVLQLLGALCPAPQPMTLETHEHGRRLAERYGLSFFDAMIAAAALLAGCTQNPGQIYFPAEQSQNPGQIYFPAEQ